MDTETTIHINELHQLVSSLEARLSTLEQTYNSYMPTSSGEDTKIEDVLTDDSAIAYGAFRWDGEKITHCYFQFGRDVVAIPDVQASGDGTYYLKVPHDLIGFNASIITTQESSDLTKTIIPLFKIEDGEITKDYRGMPVIPVRE